MSSVITIVLARGFEFVHFLFKDSAVQARDFDARFVQLVACLVNFVAQLLNLGVCLI